MEGGGGAAKRVRGRPSGDEPRHHPQHQYQQQLQPPPTPSKPPTSVTGPPHSGQFKLPPVLHFSVKDKSDVSAKRRFQVNVPTRMLGLLGLVFLVVPLIIFGYKEVHIHDDHDEAHFKTEKFLNVNPNEFFSQSFSSEHKPQQPDPNPNNQTIATTKTTTVETVDTQQEEIVSTLTEGEPVVNDNAHPPEDAENHDSPNKLHASNDNNTTKATSHSSGKSNSHKKQDNSGNTKDHSKSEGKEEVNIAREQQAEEEQGRRLRWRT